MPHSKPPAPIPPSQQALPSAKCAARNWRLPDKTPRPLHCRTSPSASFSPPQPTDRQPPHHRLLTRITPRLSTQCSGSPPSDPRPTSHLRRTSGRTKPLLGRISSACSDRVPRTQSNRSARSAAKTPPKDFGTASCCTVEFVLSPSTLPSYNINHIRK